MRSVIIDGRELSEVELAALVESLQLYYSVCFGQLEKVGQVLYHEYSARSDVTIKERQCVNKARDLLAEADSVMYSMKDQRSNKPVVPIPGIRAYQILGRITDDPRIVRFADDCIREQAEMAAGR